MNNKISIIGGDLRMANLAKLYLEDEVEIATFAIEKAEETKGCIRCNSLKEAIEHSTIIISSIPLSKDGKYINTPFSDEKIELQEFYEGLSGKILISGNLEERFVNSLDIKTFDLLQMEEYAILNAIPTAEGAIQIAMEEYPKTIFDSNILIMGFGRIGKILAKMLQGIGANVFCEARKKSDLAYIEAYGYQPIDLQELDENLNKFDIIINNIPTMILTTSRLDLLKNDVLIIDLASHPGGVDFEYAKKKNIKTIWALALPGKVAPVSSAEYIKEMIKNIL